MGSSIHRLRIGAFIAACTTFHQSAFAQTAASMAAPPARGQVSGVVQRPVNSDIHPVAGVMVTVHRVGSDSSGALDSARTDAHGRYTVTYRRFGEDEAVYFAAAVYAGIAYFSAPLRGPTVRGDDGIITVFDTTTKPHAIAAQGHHVVVSGPRPDGKRDVIEVWELSNDTSVTLVGKDSVTPVWTADIPAGAAEFAAGQGDVGAAALSRKGARVQLLAPFGPGIKQITYTYKLPSKAFPLTVIAASRTGVFEVLLEEQSATADGSSLKATASATTQGRTFKRYLAQDVKPGARINIRAPVTTAATREIVLRWLSVVVAISMIAALVFAFSRRRLQPLLRTEVPESQALAASIARLDIEQEKDETRRSEGEYAAARSDLKVRLARALEREITNT